MRQPVPAIKRLESNVIKVDSGCHEWQGARRGPMGYSSLRNNVGELPTAVYGHIVSYRHHKGDVPQGMLVRHTCDNPICVNPEHLVLGTHKDNRQDVIDREREGDCTPYKITEDDVREIRKLSAAGLGILPIAARFKVGKSQVSRIIRRERWAHVI
jgi:hypothetical protein